MSRWLSDSHEGKRLYHLDRQLALEERLIKRILTKANLPMQVGRMVNDCRALTGQSSLNFEWFQHEYPTFPVNIGAARIPYLHKVTVGELFGPLTKTPYFKAYIKFLDERALDDTRDRVAFCFPWSHTVKGGPMTLHNYPVDAGSFDPNLREDRGARLIRPFGNPLVVYVMESFDDFLETLGDWATSRRAQD